MKLSFCHNHPMAYTVSHKRGAELVLLAIDPFVALLEDTVYTDCNSTDQAHSAGDDHFFLEQLDYNAIRADYVSRDSSYFKPHQAEVMVKQFVSADLILNLDRPYRLSF